MNELFRNFAMTMNEKGPSREMLICSLLFTLSMAGILTLTYRLIHTKLSYNGKFNINLLMMALLSNVLLLLIQKNPLLSLGAFGSLSICRIRMNTKDPRDLGFVFWALSIGLLSAMGAYIPGIICTGLLSVLVVFFSRILHRRKKCTVVIRGHKPQFGEVEDVFKNIRGVTVQSKNIFEESFELVYQIRINPKKEEAVLSSLNHVEGLLDVNVLAPETEAA